jgi:protein tyrosine phosphatase (PTP) superfamily phosphohydrolase (DUF442 family)
MKMKHPHAASSILIAAGSILATLVGCSTSTVSRAPAAATVRPVQWAQPLAVEGLPNAYKVDANLYRGAQPTAEGLQALKAIGVKTIVNLRTADTDLPLLGDTGLTNVWISMRAVDPSDEANAELLRVLSDKSKGPFFVHCKHGADRTGQAMAVYRVAMQGWDREAAIAEMRDGGYGFFPFYLHLATYVRNLNLASVRPAMGAVVSK